MAASCGSRVSLVKRRRSYRKHGESEEETLLNFEKDPIELMQEILFHVVQPDVSKKKKLVYLNGLVKLCQKTINIQSFSLSFKDIFCCLRVSLFHEACEVRAAGLRACRYLLQSIEAAENFCQMKLHFLVARSLDVVLDNRMERIHALRLMRKFLCINPLGFPSVFTNSLVSMANDGIQESELMRACLATLAQFTLLSPEACANSNGINALLKNVCECQQPQLTEAILGVLLFLYNDPKTRHMLKTGLGFESLLAPFTDCHYHYPSEIGENPITEDRDAKLAATKFAVVSVLRSWSGITYFSRTQNPELPTLVEMLHLPYFEMRKNILDLMFEVFSLPIPEWTDNFYLAATSADPSAIKNSWQLCEGYIVAEGNSLLPYSSKDRPNLVENYFALLLLMFVQAGILEALVEVIITGIIHLAVRATILLGELLYMCNGLLPSDCCHHCNCLPALISASVSFKTPEERKQTSAAVSCLYRIHELKRHGKVPNSLVLQNLIHNCDHESSKRKDFLAISKAKLHQYLKKDSSEIMLNQALKDTLVLSKEYHYWDWDLLDSILKNPTDVLKKLEDLNHRMVIQKLLYFYKPSSKQFSEIDSSAERSHQIVVTGCHFFEFLLDLDEIKCKEYLDDFLMDLNYKIVEVAKDNASLTAILSPTKVLNTLSNSYFLFIGRLSYSSKGCKVLSRCGAFQNLLQLVSVTTIDTHAKLVISALDYSREGFARTILSKVLTGANEASRLYATNFLKLLLRAGLPDFRKWVIEFLVTQLYDKSAVISNAAVDVLEEACNIQENLEALVTLRPSLLHLGDKGLLLLLRFLSISSGFRSLQDSNFLYYELDRWKKTYNLKYVKIVEDMLNESLTRHRRCEDGTYGRRSSDTRHSACDVFLPHHMYGQLIQHSEGLGILMNEDCLFDLFSTINFPDYSSELKQLHLKAALWAVGHVGSYPLGLPLILKHDMVTHIVRIAAESPVLSIRGTCFFVLGLIGTMPEGAAVLADAGWETIQRNHAEQVAIIRNVPVDAVVSYHTSSISSSESEWPIGGLPYSLSFAMQNSEPNLSASQSTQNFDIEDSKKSTSSSFSSTSSVQVQSAKQENDIRPRSSSDCQPIWKDVELSKMEAISWDSLSTDKMDTDTQKNALIKERSISSYEMVNQAFLFEMNNDKNFSGCQTEKSKSYKNNNYLNNLNSLQQMKSLSTVPNIACAKYADVNGNQPSLLRQLSRGQSCYLRSPPSPDSSSLYEFASIKDAQGYVALKNIQRRRVQSLCAPDIDSYVIDQDILHPKLFNIDIQTIPISQVQHIPFSQSSNSLRSMSSETFERDISEGNAPTESTRFIGLCLPSHSGLIFKVNNEAFSDIDFDFAKPKSDSADFEFHTISNCLANSSFHVKDELLRLTIDEENEEVGSTMNNENSNKNISCRAICDRSSEGSLKSNEDTLERSLVRKEVIRCVTNLGSSVAVKASEQGLLNLKQKFPGAFQDICLYTEICLQMAKYNFRLPARRFLQELFLDISFIELEQEAKSCISVMNFQKFNHGQT